MLNSPEFLAESQADSHIAILDHHYRQHGYFQTPLYFEYFVGLIYL